MAPAGTPAAPPGGGVYQKAGPSRYPHVSLGSTSTGAENINSVALKTALAAIDQPLSGTVRADRLDGKL
nr:hypothetical protein OG409_37405 [Streptomyces sp. NBC_00974]